MPHSRWRFLRGHKSMSACQFPQAAFGGPTKSAGSQSATTRGPALACIVQLQQPNSASADKLGRQACIKVEQFQHRNRVESHEVSVCVSASRRSRYDFQPEQARAATRPIPRRTCCEYGGHTAFALRKAQLFPTREFVDSGANKSAHEIEPSLPPRVSSQVSTVLETCRSLSNLSVSAQTTANCGLVGARRMHAARARLSVPRNELTRIQLNFIALVFGAPETQLFCAPSRLDWLLLVALAGATCGPAPPLLVKFGSKHWLQWRGEHEN